MRQFSYICRDPADTSTVAATLAPLLRAGDVLLLEGGLAAGKTYFVQSLVGALGSDARVSSPTFGIANFYRTRAGMFLHVDAYRLAGAAEYRDLALEDYAAESILAVEWGDRIEGEFSGYLSISFEFVNDYETSRKLTISSSADRWAPVFESLRKTLIGVPVS